jgi:hypothetical protein
MLLETSDKSNLRRKLQKNEDKERRSCYLGKKTSKTAKEYSLEAMSAALDCSNLEPKIEDSEIKKKSRHRQEITLKVSAR